MKRGARHSEASLAKMRQAAAARREVDRANAVARWADPAFRARHAMKQAAFARSDAPTAVANRERLRASNEARRLPLESPEQRLHYEKLRRWLKLSREAALAEVLRGVAA